MSIIIGYTSFGDGTCLASDLPPINNITYINLTDSQFTEIFVRENTSNVDETPTEETWDIDTILDAKFENDLEAGNINNEGITITNVNVNRRIAGTLTNLTLATLPFSNDTQVNYTDYTAPMGDFVYQIVPVGENGLQGKPNEVSVTSDFYGWWLVDKTTPSSYQFDLTISGDNNISVTDYISTTLNQGRNVIQTLNKYPQIYYTPMEYHEFTLQSALVSETYTWDEYQTLISLLQSHIPMLLKSGSGDYYVVDVYAPSKTTLLNAYQGYDFGTIQISVTEIMDYDDYITS